MDPNKVGIFFNRLKMNFVAQLWTFSTLANFIQINKPDTV
jgi:hypothetical protein